MTQQYQLISQLHNAEQEQTNKTKYQQYQITVENQNVSVLIPYKHSKQFEQDLMQNQHIEMQQLQEFIQYYNGIKET